MCEPVSASMAALAVVSSYQQQEAAEKAADAQNARYEQNQALQNEAYAKDMEAFYDKEVDMKLQDFKSAEDAADAKLDQQIEAQQAQASLRMANISSASGQSAGRSVAVLSRQLSEQAFDIDDQLRDQQFGTRRDMESMHYDKIERHNSAVGAINSVARAEYSSAADRSLGLITAGLGGYETGKSMMAGSKTPGTGGTGIPASSSKSSVESFSGMNKAQKHSSKYASRRGSLLRQYT